MAEKSIKKNYVYNVIFQIVTIIAPLITMPYVARILEADFIGYYSYANSIATYFAMFSGLGIGVYGAREASILRNDREERSKLFWELTLIKIVTSSLMMAAYLIAVFINGVNIPVYLACGVAIISVAFDCTWFLQAMEDFKSLMVRNFVIKVISVVCIFSLVKEKNDLPIYILAQTASTLIANILVIPKLIKHIDRVKFGFLSFQRHFRQILIYFVPTVATSVYTVLDRTMLGFLTRSTLENGYYEQAHRVINIMLTAVTSVNIIIGMRTSYLFGQGDDKRIKKYIRKTFKFMSLISLPMIFGIVGCARNFVPIFFGAGYDKVAPVLMMSTPLVFIIGISNIIGVLYLTPSGQRSKGNRAIIIGAVINFVLNLILIPIFKSYGAVASSLIAEGIIALIYIHYMRQYFTFWDVFKAALKYAIISGVMLTVVALIGYKNHGFDVLCTQILVGIVIYVLGLLITKDEIVFEEINKIRLKLKGKKDEQ